MSKSAIVMGAGIQGVCVALMLEKRGFKVQLVDKNKQIMNRASFNQEGKIHLGFVYGLDQSLKTAEKLLHDSLNFGPYLDYLFGEKVNWETDTPQKFDYLVSYDSLMDTAAIENYFWKVQDLYQEIITNKTLNYLGKRPALLFEKTIIPSYINKKLIKACFSTEEKFISQELLRNYFFAKITNSENIQLLTEKEIIEISEKSYGYEVLTKNKNNEVEQLESEILVNCLWESKLQFDKMLGLGVSEDYSIRLKYGLFANSNSFLDKLNSFTVIQGAYGDFVNRAYTQEAYFCWYPSSMKGIVDVDKIPKEWDRICDGEIKQQTIEEIIQGNFKNFKKLIPDLPKLSLRSVRGGMILAKGNTDISKRNSLLHTRNEFPILNRKGYFSINTGKFTSGPRNTYILERMMFSDDLHAYSFEVSEDHYSNI